VNPNLLAIVSRPTFPLLPDSLFPNPNSTRPLPLFSSPLLPFGSLFLLSAVLLFLPAYSLSPIYPPPIQPPSLARTSLNTPELPRLTNPRQRPATPTRSPLRINKHTSIRAGTLSSLLSLAALGLCYSNETKNQPIRWLRINHGVPRGLHGCV
jgi:hypothetical protein